MDYRYTNLRVRGVGLLEGLALAEFVCLPLFAGELLVSYLLNIHFTC